MVNSLCCWRSFIGIVGGSMKLLNDEKAQISAELIIIMAAVLAVALIVVTQLQSTAEKGSEKIGEKSEDIFDKLDNISG